MSLWLENRRPVRPATRPVDELRASSQEPGVSEMVEDWVRILECGSGNLDSGYPPGLIPE